jgi:hypothetical protein
VVIEAQLTTNASFIKTNIEENLSVGASLGKIDVNYTGSEDLSFVLGGKVKILKLMPKETSL